MEGCTKSDAKEASGKGTGHITQEMAMFKQSQLTPDPLVVLELQSRCKIVTVLLYFVKFTFVPVI